MVKRIPLFVLGLALAVVVPQWMTAGLVGPDTAQAAKAAQRPVVWAVKTEARGLDPHQFDYDYDQKPQRGALEPLLEHRVQPDGSIKLTPVLAESWSGSDDAKVWTFKLRPGIKFHDGTPWDAAAAKWNFDRVFALKKVPAVRIPKNTWPAEGGIEAVDEMTLRITLSQPFAPFPELLVKKYMISPTAAKAHVKDDDYAQAWCNENMVGTGPYLLEEWVKGQYISLKKNPDYWGGWEGNHAERIILRYVREASTHRLLLEKGDVDLSEKIALDDLAAVAKAPGVVVEEHKAPRLLHFYMRQEGPFKDVRVRRAMAHAFDYEAFINGVWNGRAGKALSPLPSTVWTYEPQPEIKYDLELAKKLLAEAGYPNGGFEVMIYILSSFGWFQPREAQILQASLKKLGIEAKIVDFQDAGAAISTYKKPSLGPSFFAWTFANSYNDPEDNLRSNYTSDGTSNFAHISNPKYDELINKGAVTGDQAQREAIYKELQKMIWEDYNAIYTAEEHWFVTRREALHGFDFYPFVINMSPNWYLMWVSE